nr:hypothetical protein OG999_20975 [Streptomyces sp. NBC_00886]
MDGLDPPDHLGDLDHGILSADHTLGADPRVAAAARARKPAARATVPRLRGTRTLVSPDEGRIGSWTG